MEQIFMHELSNDVIFLETLILKLDPRNDIVKKITDTVFKIKAKCKESSESKTTSNLDLAAEIKKSTAKFDSLKVSFMVSSRPMIFTNKIKLDDFLTNICRNAVEAGADQLRIEIRDSSVIFYDNGKCSREIVNKLREGTAFSTKIGGKGIGTQSMRAFCNDHNIVIGYYLSPSIDYKFKKESLAIKLILK
ncbi:MAG: hypothetical protein WC635_06350 [Bacteriovorax sp.]|jgi:hypothetical protein